MAMTDSTASHVSGSALLIVPTYNERENLLALMQRIPCIRGLEILFVDDHSSDGTPIWIREQPTFGKTIHLLERPRKMGLGTAYIDGFRWALRRSYEAIFEMDADLSHDPAELPNFLKKIEEGADLVIGSRYVGGIRIINWPLNRLALSCFAAGYTRFLTGLPVSDPTSGFKCFHRRVLEKLDLTRIQSNGYAFQIEVNFYAWRMGFRLQEIPIIFTDRSQGSSKMNPQIVREAVWLVPRLGLKRLLGCR